MRYGEIVGPTYPPKAAFVTGVRFVQLPNQTARQHHRGAGGSGFIGVWLAHLLAPGTRVVGFLHSSSRATSRPARPIDRFAKRHEALFDGTLYPVVIPTVISPASSGSNATLLRPARYSPASSFASGSLVRISGYRDTAQPPR